MPVSKKQKACVQRYVKAHYDRVEAKIPAGRKTDVEDTAQEMGLSVNALVNHLLAGACGLSMEEWKKQKEE